MPYPDLEQARRHHGALKSIIGRHAGDAPDLRALRRMVDLCRGASEAIDDQYCREKIRLVAEYGAELLSRADHSRWQRRSLPGVEFLRQQALNALELFQSRLYSLEAMRRAARAAAPGYELALPRQQ